MVLENTFLEYDDVMNQQRQVVYDIRNQALSGENMEDSVFCILDDYIMDEIELQSSNGNYEHWDWEQLQQRFSSHIMIDVSLEKIQNDIGGQDETSEAIGDWIFEKAKTVLKRENH